MTAAWLLTLAAYSIQLAVLVASASVVATVLRIRAPGPALSFWRATLIAAIVLPLAQGRAPEATDALTTSAIAIGRAASTSSLGLPQLTWTVLAVVICGAAIRTAGLVLGLVRLRAIRQRARPLEAAPQFVACLTRHLGVTADIRISSDVDGPVTIGLRRPAVLLPARVLTLADALQEAVVCHELLHVRRRDWAHTVIEEIWCALLWFHPAARLLVARIALMREAVVDRHTVEITGDRRAYAQALMTFAEPAGRAPVAAPALIRPRHLSQRIALLAKEAPMSRGHTLAAFTIGFAALFVATLVTASRFPVTLTAAKDRGTMLAGAIAQEEAPRPGNGVSVPRAIREVRPEYTRAALQAKIQGSLEMDVVVLPSGEPSDIRIVRSLDTVYGLDEAAMRAAAQWRFEPGRREGKPVPVTITVEMTFTLK